MAIGRTNAGGGGTGGTLTVTGVAGSTVTVSNGDKSYTRTLGSDGTATFKGLTSGTWTVTMTDGTQTAEARTVKITSDYTTITAYFAATINVTYPAGSTCTATDGTTTLTAPDATGTWACIVPNAGTWTVSCTDGTYTASDAVSITAGGQTASVELVYTLYLYDSGDECTDVTGGWTVSTNITEASAKKSDCIWTGNLISSGNQSRIYMKNPSSVIKKYSTLNIQISRPQVVDIPSFGLISGTTSPASVNNANKSSLYIAYKDVGSQTETIALDISNATVESMRVLLLSFYSTYIYKIWLEP